jgi:hypothetical protein
VYELISLVLTTILAWARRRQDLVLENLLLRHQLAVLTRPTRTRRHTRLRLCDKAALDPGSSLVRRLARAVRRQNLSRTQATRS